MDQPVNSSDPQPSEQNAGDPGYTENAEKSEQQPESSGSVMAQDAPDAPSDSTPDAVPNEEPAHELVAQSEQQSPDYTEDTSMEDTMQEDEGNQEGETDGVNAVGADASSEQQQQQEQQQQPPAVQETVNTTAKNNEPEERIQPANMEIQEEPAQPSNPNPSSFFNTPASWQIPPSALQQRPENEAVNDNTLNKANIRREKLEQRIANDEYDIAAWNSLINEIQQTGDLTATRDIYERFLKIFPTSVSNQSTISSVNECLRLADKPCGPEPPPLSEHCIAGKAPSAASVSIRTMGLLQPRRRAGSLCRKPLLEHEIRDANSNKCVMHICQGILCFSSSSFLPITVTVFPFLFLSLCHFKICRLLARSNAAMIDTRGLSDLTFSSCHVANIFYLSLFVSPFISLTGSVHYVVFISRCVLSHHRRLSGRKKGEKEKSVLRAGWLSFCMVRSSSMSSIDGRNHMIYTVAWKLTTMRFFVVIYYVSYSRNTG